MANKIDPMLARLESCPPFLVFYMARSGRRGPTPVHLGRFRNNNPKRLPRSHMIKEAGMSARTFQRLAQRLSWKDFTVGDMFAFCRACRFDWSQVWALRRTVKNQMRDGEFKPSHLEGQQLQRFNKLAAQWSEQRRAIAVQNAA